jgi:hypothetical protein
MFHGHLDYFRGSPLGGRPNTNDCPYLYEGMWVFFGWIFHVLQLLPMRLCNETRVAFRKSMI